VLFSQSKLQVEFAFFSSFSNFSHTTGADYSRIQRNRFNTRNHTRLKRSTFDIFPQLLEDDVQPRDCLIVWVVEQAPSEILVQAQGPKPQSVESGLNVPRQARFVPRSLLTGRRQNVDRVHLASYLESTHKGLTFHRSDVTWTLHEGWRHTYLISNDR